MHIYSPHTAAEKPHTVSSLYVRPIFLIFTVHFSTSTLAANKCLSTLK